MLRQFDEQEGSLSRKVNRQPEQLNSAAWGAGAASLGALTASSSKSHAGKTCVLEFRVNNGLLRSICAWCTEHLPPSPASTQHWAAHRPLLVSALTPHQFIMRCAGGCVGLPGPHTCLLLPLLQPSCMVKYVLGSPLDRLLVSRVISPACSLSRV